MTKSVLMVCLGLFLYIWTSKSLIQCTHLSLCGAQQYSGGYFHLLPAHLETSPMLAPVMATNVPSCKNLLKNIRILSLFFPHSVL